MSPRTIPVRCLALALGAAVLPVNLTPAQAGTLDPTFGTGGKVTTGFMRSGTDESARTVVASQADGKLVVAGNRYAANGMDIVLARYHADGSLDTSFGSGGIVITDVTPNDQARALAIQSDGRIVVAGSVFAPNGMSYSDFVVLRYNPDGSPDPTFGTAGVVVSQLGSSEEANAVAIQADGRILVAGYINTAAGPDFALVRYQPDGTLDSTFGTGGTVVTNFSGNEWAYALAVQADGRIVAAGTTWVGGVYEDFAVARYLADGTLDATFGVGGKATTHISSWDGAYAVAIQPDGAIVAAGYSYSIAGQPQFALVRYLANGSLDPSFGTGGKAVTRVGVDQCLVRSLALQPDGRIVAVGYGVGSGATSYDMALARYLSNGALDAAFGEGGKVLVHFGGTEFGSGVALQADGRIVTAGSSWASTATLQDLALARLLTNGSLDPSFGNNGKVTTDIGGPAEERAHDLVAVQADGNVVIAGTTRTPTTFNDFALARYRPDGSLDPAFGTGGTVLTDFAGAVDEARSVTIQADGMIVAAGDALVGAGWDFALARYRTDGSLDTGFGNGGKVITDFGSWDDHAYSVTVQPDGKVLVAGTTYLGDYDLALARYNADGSLDGSFRGGGRFTIDLGSAFTNSRSHDHARALALQSDGKFLVAGFIFLNGLHDFVVARFHANGYLDGTFGSNGVVVTALTSQNDFAYGMTVQADGRIVVVGQASENSNGQAAIVRYNPDGSLDTSFGGTGKVFTTFWYHHGNAFRDVAIQGDGRIVAAGYGAGGVTADFAMARFNTDGTLDSTFGWGGWMVTDFAGGEDRAYAIAVQTGKIVLAGEAATSGGPDIALARYIGYATPAQLLEELAQLTENLAADTVLNHGQASALESKLDAAIHQVDRANNTAAINQLLAFVNQINALVRAGTLTQAQGQGLYDRAMFLISLLS